MEGEAVSKEADIQLKERGMHHQLGREAEKAFRGKAKHGAGGGESEPGTTALGRTDAHPSGIKVDDTAARVSTDPPPPWDHMLSSWEPALLKHSAWG